MNQTVRNATNSKRVVFHFAEMNYKVRYVIDETNLLWPCENYATLVIKATLYAMK